MARYFSILFTTVLAAIFIFPANGRNQQKVSLIGAILRNLVDFNFIWLDFDFALISNKFFNFLEVFAG